MKGIPSISIVICCYNSETRLNRVLQAIAAQKNVSPGQWEVLVVNNNSTDNTGVVAGTIFSSALFNGISCRVVDEPQPGLSAAREKGFQESAHNYVLFCDDDNVLHENFIAHALQLIQEFPDVDIFGSWCQGEYEIPPPGWSSPMLSALAVGRPAAQSGYIQNPVNGACMLVNKQAYTALKSRSFQFLLSDRKGAVLTSGGDSELCYAVLLSGGRIYFSDKLFFTHLIPAVRLTKSYFKKLYLIPAKQDFVSVIYQQCIKNKQLSFVKLYSFLLFNYAKTLAYCIKQMMITGNLFYYSLLFKQRFNFLIYSLFHPKEISNYIHKVVSFSKSLKY